MSEIVIRLITKLSILIELKLTSLILCILIFSSLLNFFLQSARVLKGKYSCIIEKSVPVDAKTS